MVIHEVSKTSISDAGTGTEGKSTAENSATIIAGVFNFEPLAVDSADLHVGYQRLCQTAVTLNPSVTPVRLTT